MVQLNKLHFEHFACTRFSKHYSKGWFVSLNSFELDFNKYYNKNNFVSVQNFH